MTATTEFFTWFYYGMQGLGGWFLFMLLSLFAVIWLIYNSSVRRLPVIGWRLAIILTACLLLPAILYRFTVTNPFDITEPLAPFAEPIFYLGMLGGVLPFVLAIGYFVQYQGMIGDEKGHVYEEALGECPECARERAKQRPSERIAEPKRRMRNQDEIDYSPPKAKAPGWLILEGGKTKDLYLGETTIGRGSDNLIELTGDTTISRYHAKIIEQNGKFYLVDLGSANFTFVNGNVVRDRVLLEHDDEIRFGKNTTTYFVTKGR